MEDWKELEEMGFTYSLETMGNPEMQVIYFTRESDGKYIRIHENVNMCYSNLEHCAYDLEFCKKFINDLETAMENSGIHLKIEINYSPEKNYFFKRDEQASIYFSMKSSTEELFYEIEQREFDVNQLEREYQQYLKLKEKFENMDIPENINKAIQNK